MAGRIVFLVILMTVLVHSGGVVLGDSADSASAAAGSFAAGNTLVLKGEFEAALQAYRQAVTLDPEHQDYRQHYVLLRRIVQLQQTIGDQDNLQNLRSMAGGLRAFYYENKLYDKALTLDQKIHGRFNDADSAASLAATYLVLDKNTEAAGLLGKLNDQTHTIQTRVLLGIACAREGDTDQARAIADQCTLPQDANPRLIYDLACLQALVGHSEQAVALLRRCFESTPPSRLQALKADVRQDTRNLGALMGQPAFAQVMETRSAVAESKCSGGQSCAKCPSRNKCARSAAQDGGG